METFKKLGLEFLRTILAAIISFLLTEGVINLLVNLFLGEKLDPASKLIIISGLTGAIKSIDRSLHDAGTKSKTEGWLGAKGLFGF